MTNLSQTDIHISDKSRLYTCNALNSFVKVHNQLHGERTEKSIAEYLVLDCDTIPVDSVKTLTHESSTMIQIVPHRWHRKKLVQMLEI
jgi:hypothetical protein